MKEEIINFWEVTTSLMENLPKTHYSIFENTEYFERMNEILDEIHPSLGAMIQCSATTETTILTITPAKINEFRVPILICVMRSSYRVTDIPARVADATIKSAVMK